MKISWKIVFALILLFMISLPFAVISCSDREWVQRVENLRDRCDVSVTAVTKQSRHERDYLGRGKYLDEYRPVFSYSYEGETYETAYAFTYETDPYPEKTELTVNIDPANPKACWNPNDPIDHTEGRTSGIVMLLPLVPLGGLIWCAHVRRQQRRYEREHPQLVDPEDMPAFLQKSDSDGSKMRVLKDPLYLTVRGTGLAFPSNPSFCETASLLYKTAERLDMDDRFRAFHGTEQPVHLFYLDPDRSEWLMAIPLPQQYIRHRALSALHFAADKLGLSDVEADVSLIGCSEEQTAQEATDLVKYYPVNSDSADMWMLHEVFADDVRKVGTEPVRRSLMLHVKYKGKEL